MQVIYEGTILLPLSAGRYIALGWALALHRSLIRPTQPRCLQ